MWLECGQRVATVLKQDLLLKHGPQRVVRVQPRELVPDLGIQGLGFRV